MPQPVHRWQKLTLILKLMSFMIFMCLTWIHESKYGSYFRASIDMLRVEPLPLDGTPLNRILNLSLDSMSEPPVLVYHERLEAHERNYVYCCSSKVWRVQEGRLHSDAAHEFLEVHRRHDSPFTLVVFALAHIQHFFASLMLSSEGEPTVPGEHRCCAYYSRPGPGYSQPIMPFMSTPYI